MNIIILCLCVDEAQVSALRDYVFDSSPRYRNISSGVDSAW